MKPKGNFQIKRLLLELVEDRRRLVADGEELFKKIEQIAQDIEQWIEERIQKEKLAIMDQLAKGIAHELRNNLAVIRASIYYLSQQKEAMNPSIKRHLEKLDRQSVLSDKIVTDLLDFSREQVPHVVQVNLNNLVEETLAQLEIPDPICVVRDLDPHLPSISVDPQQIQKVFLNLLSNAVQAMPLGGTLTVTTRKDQGSGAEGPGASEVVEISFKDTGVGIPPENLSRIFEPLFTTKARGIGLGLAISKLYVERHKGTIEAESRVNQGSTFTIKLPANQKKESTS